MATFDTMDNLKKEKTLFVGMLLIPIILFLLEGRPAINAQGTICYETWKSHFFVTRILLGIMAILSLFVFRNWFFKVLVLVVMVLTIMGTYVTGWIWADVSC
jgi:hypothetical protein